jgi:endonuclease YncB( thermonuclease family)
MLHGRCGRNTPTRASWIGALFVWAIFCPGLIRAQSLAQTECPADHIDAWGYVESIFDGDTIRLRDRRVIRFIAINAPELAHDGRAAEPLALAAKTALMQYLPVGSRVGLRYDEEHTDHYQRVLAHVFDSQGRNISAVLLREGYGFAIAVPPNLWQSSCYYQQEAIAHTASLGVWGIDYYQPKNAQTLRSRTGGFYRVTGRVKHIGNSKRSVWLEMGDGFAVRIPRKALQYFAAEPIASWRDKVITVRGWARFYNHQLNMTLTHPAMVEAIK